MKYKMILREAKKRREAMKNISENSVILMSVL